MQKNRIFLATIALLSMVTLLVPFAYASKIGWKVNGSGWITLTGGPQATFSFVADEIMGPDGSLKGKMDYADPSAGKYVHGYDVDEMNMWDPDPEYPHYTAAFFGGPCTINGVDGFRFQVAVHDHGEPGTNDVFLIMLFDFSAGTFNQIYNSGEKTLGDGNIQIHVYVPK